MAQVPAGQEGIAGSADLDDCLAYTMKHQPLVEQLKISDMVRRRDIGIALSDWLPQVEINAGFQQYLRQPVSIFPDFENPSGPKREITTGVRNTSSVQLSADQVIYSPDAFLAGRTAKLYRLQSTQSVHEAMVDLVVRVSKAFYDVLLTDARLRLLKEDQARIERSMKDARSQYESGISDKIDFQRAVISLNITQTEILGITEDKKFKIAYLKELMGYPFTAPLTLGYDSTGLIQETWLDTTRIIRYRNRVEYQQLLTRLNLQRSMIGYYRFGFLPSLSAFANYNLVYQNDNIGILYDRDFPNSAVGLRLTLPLFEGTRRAQQLKKANLLYKEMALDTLVFRNSAHTLYVQAIAAYKSSLKTYRTAQENSRLAGEIYNTVRLQYNQGIKTYLEVIISETDLRSSRTNELNALYRLLVTKLDVERALGNISVNY